MGMLHVNVSGWINDKKSADTPKMSQNASDHINSQLNAAEKKAVLIQTDGQTWALRQSPPDSSVHRTVVPAM